MPWFPDFVGAVELARRQTRAEGEADPVGVYLDALNSGDLHALRNSWPGEVVVYDPHAGEVRGHRQLRQFVHRNQVWLAERHARIETVAATCVDGRAVVELLAHLTDGGRETAWPVAVVAESPDDRSVVFRTYCSQLAGRPPPPHPAADPPARGTRSRATSSAATSPRCTPVTPTRSWAPSRRTGTSASPSERTLHRGAPELRAYFDRCFSAAAASACEHCAITDDGARCVLEYNCVSWGRHTIAPQAGLAVYERGADGLLAAARLYDDLEAPAR